MTQANNSLKVQVVECPYCKGRCSPIPSTYRGKTKYIYKCRTKGCDAYVGCHPGSLQPLGTPANYELRQWRSLVHQVFDPIWRHTKLKRNDAYTELADLMKIDRDECHMAQFDVARCKVAVFEASKMRVKYGLPSQKVFLPTGLFSPIDISEDGCS